MKYYGHESFCIRKNWLSKGIRKIDSFKKEELLVMDDLGIGKNMVKSLRYWLKVTGITIDEPKRKEFSLSPLGKIIKEYDPYTEEFGTIWLLHYEAAGNLEQASAWYFFFNEFNQTEFSSEDFLTALKKWDEMNNTKAASETSLEKDFDCIRRMYLSRDFFKNSRMYEAENSKTENLRKEESGPESNMECPFSELGLLQQTGKNIFRKTSPLKQNIPPLIALAVILSAADGKKEIKLSSLQNDPCNIGKIFNLDTILLITILGYLENMEYLQIVRTAGLDVVKIKTEMSFLECVKKYYEALGND